jgi:hypothetical protein
MALLEGYAGLFYHYDCTPSSQSWARRDPRVFFRRYHRALVRRWFLVFVVAGCNQL